MKLHDYWRSTSSYRLRIALNLKGLSPDRLPVHLVRDGGEHRKPAYRQVNPQGRVPALTLDDGATLIQSPAIIEYIEEAYPKPALLPVDIVERAKVRAVAAIIGCDIHPLHNVGPLNVLRKEFGASEDQIKSWIGKWIGGGFHAIERLIAPAPFAFGTQPGIADVYLVPQIYAARRFNVSLDTYPKILAVENACAAHDAFALAHPSRQPDAE